MDTHWSEDILSEAVAAAVMAPSTHNTQPWRFRIAGKTLDIFADPARQLHAIDPVRRQQIQSCGCALYNARVAVRALGVTDEVTVMLVDNVERNHVATLHLGAPRSASADDLALVKAIRERHTNRRAFLPRPVASVHTDAMAADAAAEGATLVRLLPEQKIAIAHLVDHADRIQLAKPEVVAELGRWLAPVGSRRRDGIPFAEKEYGSSLPFARALTLRSHDFAPKVGQLEEEHTLESPAIVVIGTASDEPADWLVAGQALEAVLLRATSLGLSASFLNQVLEVPELRDRVHDLVPAIRYPQMVLRIGVAADSVRHPAPRRDLDEVLFTTS